MAGTLDVVGSERLEELRRVLVRGPMPVTVVIAGADPTWPAQYEAYAAALQSLLGERLLLVEHVGSTSPTSSPPAGSYGSGSPATAACAPSLPSSALTRSQRRPPTCTVTGQATLRSAGTCSYETGCEPIRPPAPDTPT